MIPIIQEILNKLCQEEPLNGTWLQALGQATAENEGEVDTNGNQWQFIANNVGITEPINGSWQQAIAVTFGSQEPINGTWLQALSNNITDQNCGGGSQPYVTNGYVTNGYVLSI